MKTNAVVPALVSGHAGHDFTWCMLSSVFSSFVKYGFGAGDSVGQFSGVLDCFSQTFKKEGILAFYNGFGPNFARLGSWNVVMFLTVEQVKKLFIPKDAL